MEKLNARSQPHPLGCVVGTGARRNTETDDIRKKEGEKKSWLQAAANINRSLRTRLPPAPLTPLTSRRPVAAEREEEV